VYKLCLAPPDNPGGCVSAQNYQIQVSVAKKVFSWATRKANICLQKRLIFAQTSTFCILKLLDKEKIQAGLKYLVSTNVIQL